MAAIQSIAQKSIPISQNYTDVCWNGANFYAIARNSSVVAKSTDGITWTTTTPNGLFAYDWDGITSGVSGSMVAHTYTNNWAPGIAYSTNNGVDWTQLGNPAAVGGPYTRGVYSSFLDRILFLTKSSPAYLVMRVATASVNTFQAHQLSSTYAFNDVIAGPLTVALPTAHTSFWWGSGGANDSNSWTANTTTYTGGSMPSGKWTGAYGNNIYVAVCSGSATYGTSTDGKVWTVRTLPVSGTWSRLRFGVGVFLAISDDGKALVSSDGLSWTQLTIPAATYTGLCSNSSCFVAVSNGSVGLLSIHVKITGTVRDENGNYAARTVRCYDRATGSLASETTSNATTGAFTLYPNTSGSCYVVALDDDAGTVLNALIYDRVVPA